VLRSTRESALLPGALLDAAACGNDAIRDSRYCSFTDFFRKFRAGCKRDGEVRQLSQQSARKERAPKNLPGAFC